MASGILFCRGIILAAAIAPLFAAHSSFAGPASPTADGFAAAVTGGGGVGDVYHVTTLESDPTGVVPGSLRYGLYNKNLAVDAAKVYGKRTIVFDIGGTLDLGAATLDVKDVSNVTIAGQTAPTPVVITGNTTQITGSKTNNIIFQYITIRNPSAGEDSLSIKGGGPNNLILADHISTSWGKDEQISVTQGANNVTVQNSFATEALDSASHAYGALIRPDNSVNVSYRKNLFSNNRSRNPRPGSYDQVALNFDFTNNVVYNYSDRAGYTGGEGHDVVNMNYVGNYIIAGPYTTSSASQIAFTVDNSADGVNLNAYQSGNLVDSNGWGATTPGLKSTNSAGKVVYGKDAIRDGIDKGWGAFTQLTGGTAGFFNQSNTQVVNPTSRFQVDATTAYQQVIASGGNFAWNRDTTDARLISQIKAGIGDVLNAAPTAELAAVNANISSANWSTRAANFDTDRDALPDAWETQHGLNPNSTTTQLHFNATSQKVTTATSGFEGITGGESNVVSPNGYSWLEVYLNELGLQATHGGGDWDQILSWNGVLPDAQGATAYFNGGATPTNVGINASRKVGQLNLAGSGGYTLSGSGGITLDVVQGYSIVNASGGTHTIGVPVTLAQDAHFVTGAGSTLDITGALNSAGRVVTKEGAGALKVNNVRAAALNIAGGVVQVHANATANAAAGVSALASLGIANGAQLDLTNNALVLPYASGAGATTEKAIQAMLLSGQLTSSLAGEVMRLGYGDNAKLGITSVGGSDPGLSSVLVKYVFAGDCNLDGKVDIVDLGALAGNYSSTNAVWLDGDFNYDGKVNIVDLGLLAGNWHSEISVAAALAQLNFGAVPEPASIGLLALGGVLLRRRPR